MFVRDICLSKESIHFHTVEMLDRHSRWISFAKIQLLRSQTFLIAIVLATSLIACMWSLSGKASSVLFPHRTLDQGKLHRSALCQSVVSWESNAALQCSAPPNRLFDVILVSSGGVGSSALFSDMKKEVTGKLNSDADTDTLKHRLFHITSQRLSVMLQKNVSLSCATRIFVYTFADAAASVFSLYRRDFHRHHNTKLHDRPFTQRCFPANTSVYASEGVDYLGLEAHFHSWLHAGMCSRKIPVFFLRSEGRQSPIVWDLLRSSLHDPGRIFASNHSELNISQSHYASDVKTSEEYAQVRKIYARLQSQLDSLGYLSMAFRRNLQRLL
jgi:hypothetical protein